MSDIFISYAKEDRSRARVLAAALEGSGWSVFWDRTIPPGLTWHDYIGREIQEARCVLVAWSESAIQSSWVLEEAGEAQKRGVLVPLFLDEVEPPLGFRSLQAADLSKWSGDAEAPAFRQLVEGMKRLLGPVEGGGTEASESAAKPTEAGRGAKPDEVPRERRRPAAAAFLRSRTGMAAIGAVLVAVVLLVLAGGDPAIELASTFDEDDEGWEGVGGGEVTWEEECGSRDGCLHLGEGAGEGEGTIFSFHAPDHWRSDSDWTRFHGGRLNYDLKLKWTKDYENAHELPGPDENGTNYSADVVIVGSGTRGKLELRHSRRPAGKWWRFSLVLKEGGIDVQGPRVPEGKTEPETGTKTRHWMWVSAGDGKKAREATRDDFESVLSSVRDLSIRGEYYDGHDEAWLDNVSIEPQSS